MDAYFHSDPRIETWVNQITEKIFTVCLLTGVDSEVEFQSGCQIIAKLTHLLQGISIFPSEYLENGLKQLLEQQLPDSRVINNFPTFQDTMNKMLREGMSRAIETPELASRADSEILSVRCDEYPGRPLNEVNNEYVTEPVIAALASIKHMISKLSDTKEKLQNPSVDPKISAKPYGIIRKTQIPVQADRLKDVLSVLFPRVSVCWNLKLMGHTFLAQIEDILIYVHNPERPCHVETLNKEGWKVYVCSADDLMFPRRLERGIKLIQRSGIPYKNRKV